MAHYCDFDFFAIFGSLFKEVKKSPLELLMLSAEHLATLICRPF